MSGSPRYLELLGEIKHIAFILPTYESVTTRWNTVTGSPEGRELFALAATCYALLAYERKESLDQVIARAEKLHIDKNAGYSGADNPDPWANFRMSTAFGISPFDGVLVRMSDKYIRIQNLRRDPSNERVGESILDTLADLAAYSLIGICLSEEAALELG